jgi:hypothetical protein
MNFIVIILFSLLTGIVSASQDIYLKGGTVIRGDFVAKYDHSKWWWEKELKVSFAILQELPLTNVKIINQDDINLIKTKPFIIKRDLLEKYLVLKNVTLKRNPLDVPVYIATADGGHHKHEDGFGDFALDLIVLGTDKWSYRNGGKENEDFYIWDKEVFAPISGTVSEVLRNEADNKAKLNYSEDETPKFTESNKIGIYLEDNLYFYMLHFKQGTISEDINVGDQIRLDDYIGNVGNSGVTYVPHLHTTLFFWDVGTSRFWSIPINFNKALHKKTHENDWLSSENFFPEVGDEVRSF